MFEPIDRVMKMRRGDSAVPRRTQIAGQDHMLSYITPQEAGILQLLGGSGRPGPAGIPAFDGHVGGADVDSGPGAAAGFGGGDTDPERGDDKDQRQMGMSPGRAQAQFGKVGPAIFAGATDDQIADSGFRTRALADYRDLGRGRGLFGRPTFDSTYNTNMARNYIDLISRQFGPMGQKEYNEAMGVTASNPFGYEGLFSRRFGVDPRNIRSTLTQDQGQRVAQKKFDRYSDFTAQDPQSQGRAFGALPLGALTRPTGEITSQGYVRRMVQDPEDIPLGQALAVQGLALAGGIPGLLAVEMMDPFSSFAPARSPEYDPALDPEINPDIPTSANIAAAQRTGLGLGALFDRAKSAFSSPSPTVDQAQTLVPKERSVFDNFKTNIMKIPETIEDLFTPAPVVSTSSLDFMAPGASPDLAGFENRFAPAPETQQLMDASARQKALDEADTRRASEEVLRQAVGDFRTAPGLSEEAALAARVNPETIADVFETYQPTSEGTSLRPPVTNPFGTSFEQQSSLDPGRIRDAVTGGFREGIGAMAPAFETAGVLDDLGMAVKSLGGDFVAIPGGYMDKRTGRTYSGSPEAPARTFTGTKKKSVQPFSGESFIQNIGSMFSG